MEMEKRIVDIENGEIFYFADEEQEEHEIGSIGRKITFFLRGKYAVISEVGHSDRERKGIVIRIDHVL